MNEATKEKIDVMSAYLEGKHIQFKSRNGEDWIDIGADWDEPVWDWDNNSYRVKPEPKLIPFNTVEEAISYAGGIDKLWFKHKATGSCHAVVGYTKGYFSLGAIMHTVSLSELCSDYEFADGRPAGIDASEN